jgi:predicted Zn-dependent protease
MSKKDEREACVRLEFDEALRLRDAGDLAKAVEVMRRLAADGPDRASILGTLAGLEFQAGDYEGAARTARKVTRLVPRSELASLTLFHSLHRAGRLDEAFAEVARLRVIRNSIEYEKLLAEMREDMLVRLKDGSSDPHLLRAAHRIDAEIAARPIRH